MQCFIKKNCLNNQTYPLAMTSSREAPTTSGVTGTAISSTQVIYRACAAGFGNSLKRQSVAGNCTVPAIVSTMRRTN